MGETKKRRYFFFSGNVLTLLLDFIWTGHMLINFFDELKMDKRI